MAERKYDHTRAKRVDSTYFMSLAGNGQLVLSHKDSVYVNSGPANRTGTILEQGKQDGEYVRVINTSSTANFISFAAAGTSNVAAGTGIVINQNEGVDFVWQQTPNGQTSLWYPIPGPQTGADIILTDAHIFVGNAGVATDVAVSGDLTLTNTGAFTIAVGAITGAKIAANTVALSNLVQGTNGQIPIANTGSAVVYQVLSGDVTMTASGVLTVGANAITGAKIASTTITATNLVNNTITSTQVDIGLVQHISVAVSSAQILALFTTPIIGVPAQGANKTIIVENILVTTTTTATAYANGGNVTFQYSGGNAVANFVAAAVVIAGAGTSFTLRQGIDVTALANTAITITNATAAFITGTGSAVVEIAYRVI